MQSNSVKQIIICIIILLLCGIGAFFVKEYLLDEEQELSSNTEIKEKYEYNEYSLVNVTNEIIIQRYFVDFKEKMLNSKEDAYKLLDSDTKEKYDDYNSFKEYVDNSLEELKNSYIVRYDIQKNGSTTNYIVVDQYNNKYTFKAKAVLVYTVNLDLYGENTGIFE